MFHTARCAGGGGELCESAKLERYAPPIDQAEERGFPVMLHGKSIRLC